jgi:hypothetical protein
LLCLATIVTAGCGVPGSGSPVVLEGAPDPAGGAAGTTEHLPQPGDVVSATDLVDKFLEAPAAGDWEPSGKQQRIERALEHARAFLTDAASAAWKGSAQEITVVDVSPPSLGVDLVQVLLTPVGVLTENGAIEPAPAGVGPIDWKFTVDGTNGRWRLTNAPPGALLLSTKAVRDLYEARPIYFWDTGAQWLVPDLRYFAKGVNKQKRQTEVLNRLRAGPSTWLKDTVDPIPAGISADSPFAQNSRTVISLSAEAATTPEQAKKLAKQLRWSLRPESEPVELRIKGQATVIGEGNTYLEANAAASNGPDAAEEFCVASGRVVPVALAMTAPAVLDTPMNSAVESAALSRNKASAALVRPTTSGHRGLWLGRHNEALGGTQYTGPVIQAVKMSRPVWLNRPRPRVLVAADGSLWDVPQSSPAHPIAVTPNNIGPVTAMAVAPDGRRVALVAGGQVLVAGLNFGPEGDSLSVGPVRNVYTGGLTGPVGVAWSTENALLVGGSIAGASSLLEVSVDGALSEILRTDGLGASVITAVVAVARDPTTGSFGPIMIEAAGRAYRRHSTAIEPIAVSIGSPPPGSSLKPHSSTASSELTAPFYPD